MFAMLAGATWSFDQLLQMPLPSHETGYESYPVRKINFKGYTHPTTVRHWDTWECDVKAQLSQADIQVSYSYMPKLTVHCVGCMSHKDTAHRSRALRTLRPNTC